MHGIWWFEWLGAWRDGEWDSDQIDNDWYDDGVVADPIAETLTFTPTVSDPNPWWYTRYYSPGGEINVHGWIDWDRDGIWNMTDEFIVNWSGYPGDPGGLWSVSESSISVTQPFSVPDTVFGADDVVDLWLRFRLDYADNWESPTGFTRFGEVEDHRLTVVRPTRPPWDDLTIPIDVAPVITFTRGVTGIAVSIQPAVPITPVWTTRASFNVPQAVTDYGDQLTIEHTPFTPNTVYTVSLSGGQTYPGGDPVLPSSFSFTATCTNVTGVNLTVLTPGTIYTDTVVTFEADIAPDNARKPYTYTIDYDDGTPLPIATSSMDPLALTHTFATTGTYEVTFSAWNCAMTEPVTSSVTVVVSEYEVCVGLSRIAIAGESEGLPGVYNFTTSYEPPNASLPISYTWDDGGVLSTSVRALGVGVHTLMVTATNCATQDPPAVVTDTHTITISAAPVCTDVTGVDLTVSTAGTIYTDTVVTFEADIAPDDATKPYTYTIDYDDGTPVSIATSSMDPLTLTHTFATTGTYEVVFSAWNCDMTEPVTSSVTVVVSEYGVCVDLSSIAIAGATSGVPGDYTFTTSYEPPNASLPISYAWDDGSTFSTSLRILGVGVHTLMVTATNCGPAGPLVTATHTITISAAPVCTDVTGVDLTVSTAGTIYIDTLVTLEADIAPDDATKPYTYTIDYDDGTPVTAQTSSMDPLELTHSYAATGTYTVIFSAWNCAMIVPVTATVTVEVVPASEDFFIFLPLVLRGYGGP